ncbi:glycosyl hydrolase family 95 catalytic domain-containing protein [Nocardiopsis algeriensis]|uniref:glycosyl hydrolase family 95 catalytic domain-containing protein n=1 Tax=Nocardiopsis algeriensis TaxID=1478215 RepID=UPI003B42CC79
MARTRRFHTFHPVADWEDALVTGSGTLGALVHSTAERISLTLCHERLFLPAAEPLPAPGTARILTELRSLLRSGRSRDAAVRIADFAAAEHPGYADTRWIDPLVGAAVLSLEPDEPGTGPVLRTCDPGSGLVGEHVPDGTAHRVFASRPDDAVVAELRSPRGLSGRLRLGLLPEPVPVPVRVRARADRDRLSLRVDFPARPAGSLPGYTVDCAVSARGGAVRCEDGELVLSGVTLLRLAVRIGTDRPGGPAAAPRARVTGFDGALRRHRRVHGELMDRFRLRLGGPAPDAPGEELLAGGPTPELVSRLVDAGRYVTVSACGELPPTLQGVWSGTYDPPWRSGYTFDGNLFSAVAALHTTGTPELMVPVFDLLEGMAGDLRENARRLYGCRGLLLPAHASTSGRHHHFGPEWCLTCWTAGAAWAARLYWDHYSHTRDRDFLRRRAWPFLREAALFHEDFVTEEGFVPSYSPENTPADGDGQAAVNATMDVAAVRDLCRNLVRTHRILGEPGARRWAALAARLPGYRIAPGGELAEWAGPAGPVAQEERHAHRHASHLYPLWYEPDPVFAAPRWRAAAVRAVRARLAWWRGQEADEMAFGLVQLGLAAARLGLAEEAHETVSLLASRYWRPTLVPTHNRGALFNTDIGGGFPAVVAAMLLGSTEGRTDLLPALPRAWPEGRVEGLRGRGGVVVDRLEWSGGQAEAELRSVEPRTVLVGLPGGTRCRVAVNPGKAAVLRFRAFPERSCRSASKNSD